MNARPDPAMKLLSMLAKAVLPCLLVTALLQGPARAQQPPDAPPPPPAAGPAPVMENVFFNVVWGSAFGATLGVAVSVLGSDDASAPDDARSAAFSGATAGGLIGLGIALYLVYQGITFDAAGSSITTGGAPPPRPATARLEPPPFTLLTSAEQPGRITGFSARVVDIKF